MQFFELFDLPVRLINDAAGLRKKYLELSRRFHPDYVAGEGAAAVALAEEKSAQLNRAYKTLSSEEATIAYVLKERGLLEEEEKYTLPPPFLMEMLELNEAVAEAGLEEDEAALKRVEEQIKNVEDEIYEPVQGIIENYSEDTASEEALLQVKEYYMKKKYLLRLRQQLARSA